MPPNLLKKTQLAVGRLQRVGVNVPPKLMQEVQRETQLSLPRSFGRTPAVAIILHLDQGEWRLFFRKNPSIAGYATSILDLFSLQLPGGVTQNQAACRAVRRWISALAVSPDYADFEELSYHFKVHRRLPQAIGRPCSEEVVRSKDWHLKCSADITNLALGRPIGRTGEVAPPEPRNKILKLRHAQSYLDSSFDLVGEVMREVEDAMHSNLALPLQAIRARLIVLLEAYFGLTETHVQRVRIGVSGGPLSLVDSRVTIHIGNGYFPDSPSVRSDLILPALPEIEWLITRAEHGEKTGPLIDVWGKSGWDAAKEAVKSLTLAYGHSGSKYPWSAHNFHREIALYDLKQRPSEVSLFEGRPLSGFRGPFSYVSISDDEARRLFVEFRDKARSHFGLAVQGFAPAPGSASVWHGNPPVAFEDLINRLSDDVDSAIDHNSVLACVHRLWLLFGLRRTSVHPNPVVFWRRFPTPELSYLVDKAVGGATTPHLIWMADELQDLLAALEERIGDWGVLPYCAGGGKFLAYKHLPDNERQNLDPIVSDASISAVARIAFRRALREVGAGEDIMHIAMGHAPIESIMSWQRLDSVEMMKSALRIHFERLYTRFLILPLAARLTEKVRQYVVSPSTQRRKIALGLPPKEGQVISRG